MKQSAETFQIRLSDGQVINRSPADYDRGPHSIGFEIRRAGTLVIETTGGRTLEAFAPGSWTWCRYSG